MAQDLTKEIDYWNKRADARGDERERQQRLRELQSQIDQQMQTIDQLTR